MNVSLNVASLLKNIFKHSSPVPLPIKWNERGRVKNTETVFVRTSSELSLGEQIELNFLLVKFWTQEL